MTLTVAAQLDRVMVGDTVVIEQDTSGNANARKDRFYGTVAALDTATGELTLTTTQTGYYDFSLLGNESIVSMADSCTVSGFRDRNGNTAETSFGFRMDLQGTVAR
jgi:hypothetical protein